jgi:peptidoglycan DL-endopeptidase CwlO
VASHKSVTTHRAPKKTITATRTAVTLATATVGSIALVPGLAQADPNQTVNDVKHKVDDLRNQAELATEAYNTSNEQLATLQHKVDQIQSKITQEQATLTGAQTSLGSLAAVQYQTGGIDNTLQLMMATAPDTYLQQASALSQVSGRQADAVKSAQEIERQLQQDKSTAAGDLASLQKTRDLMAQQKKDIEAKQKAATDLLASLTPSQQVQYKQINQTSNPSVSRSTIASLPPAPNARAAVAVAFAEAQIGKPYVYGAAGPWAFDCSGLTMAAWAKAGVSMAHSSSQQYYDFPHIAEKDLQPGDLVIYYSTLHHVGMYIGNGMIVHAANSSSPIEISPMNSMPIAGFVRP